MEKNQKSSLATLNLKAYTWKERAFSRVLLFFEDIVKVPVFGCQHCGECILSHTAFICCQRCPKRIRNGPCGGTGENGMCEVHTERKCVWYRIYYRSQRLKRMPFLSRFDKIHNWELEKTSAWWNVATRRITAPELFIKSKIKNDITAEN